MGTCILNINVVDPLKVFWARESVQVVPIGAIRIRVLSRWESVVGRTRSIVGADHHTGVSSGRPVELAAADWSEVASAEAASLFRSVFHVSFSSIRFAAVFSSFLDYSHKLLS